MFFEFELDLERTQTHGINIYSDLVITITKQQKTN